jgi:RNA polymerase sigma-70 factor, ECF subfamily
MEAVCPALPRTGDEHAATALYDRYAPRLRRSVVRWTQDADAAEDVCQEAWLRAYRALPSFRGDADFGTWIHTIARNLVFGRGHIDGRREELMAAHPPPTATRPPTVELRVDLERAVAALPDGMRKILLLHDVQGWRHADIAAALGIAEGTSKSQLFKARAQVRRSLTLGTRAERTTPSP